MKFILLALRGDDYMVVAAQCRLASHSRKWPDFGWNGRRVAADCGWRYGSDCRDDFGGG